MIRPLLVATRDGGLKGRVDTALGWAVVVLMALSVANVLWQVGTRFVGAPSVFTDEAARYLLIWTGLLGSAYAAGQRMHLAIDLLPQAVARRSGRAGHALGVAIETIVLAFGVLVMGVGGGSLVGLTTVLDQTSASLGLPLGAVYTVLPVTGGLIAFYAALALADHARQMRGLAPRYGGPPSLEAYAEVATEARTGGPLGEAHPPPPPEAP